MQKLQNFINNQFVAPLNDKYLETFDPAIGKPYALIPDSDGADVDRAVDAARKAFPAWSSTPAAERARLLNKIADGIEARLQEFAEAESKDQGKTVTLAKTIEIPRACANFRFFAGAILHHEETSTQIEGPMGAINYTIRVPVGVAGLISPWNLPLYLLTWKIAPAISVGNTVVCKPSEFTSMTAYMLCQVIAEVLPAGVVNMVFGTGPSAGNALVAHPQVPLISFTGGTKTGEIITKASAPFCKKLSLELGGKNPNIIFDDANLDDCVATTIRSSFQNQGEICLCGSRIFVQRGIYQKFLDRFVEETKKLVVGDPRDPKTVVGALVSEQHRDKVEYYINLAKQEGGKILCGGDRPQLPAPFDGGYFVNPTVIVDLGVNCRTVQEEIFGPVVTVTPFDSEQEAIEYGNGVVYGLAATVWTDNVKRAIRVSHQVHAGTVWVNCWMLRDLRVPFGGFKASGIGREGGDHSIDFYTEQKTICLKYT